MLIGLNPEEEVETRKVEIMMLFLHSWTLSYVLYDELNAFNDYW